MSSTLKPVMDAHFRIAPISLISEHNVSMFTVQSVMNAMDRDAISGWGCVVHIIEKDKVSFDLDTISYKSTQVTTRMLKTRMD